MAKIELKAKLLGVEGVKRSIIWITKTYTQRAMLKMYCHEKSEFVVTTQFWTPCLPVCCGWKHSCNSLFTLLLISKAHIPEKMIWTICSSYNCISIYYSKRYFQPSNETVCSCPWPWRNWSWPSPSLHTFFLSKWHILSSINLKIVCIL